MDTDKFLEFVENTFGVDELIDNMFCLLLIQNLRISENVYGASYEICDMILDNTINTTIEANDKRIMLLTKTIVFKFSFIKYVIENKDKQYNNMPRKKLFEMWLSSIRDLEISMNDRKKFETIYDRFNIPKIISDEILVSEFCNSDGDLKVFEKQIIEKYDILSTYIQIIDFKEKNDKLIKSISVLPSMACVEDHKDLLAEQYNMLSQKQSQFTNTSEVTEIILGNHTIEKNAQLIKELCEESTKSIIPIGIGNVDTFLKGGGAEATRLYLWAAISGGGKSVSLVNVASNAFTWLAKNYKKQPHEKKAVVVLITMENRITETIQRLVSCMTGEPLEQIIYKGDEYCVKRFNDVFVSKDVDIIVKYFPKLGMPDLNFYLKGLEATYNVKSVIIDYLDLISAKGIDGDQFWRVIGSLCREMKILCTAFECSIHTASQIGRKGYDVDRVSNGMIADGIKKIDNADTVILMNRQQDTDTFDLTITKNRNFKTGQCYVDCDWDVYKLNDSLGPKQEDGSYKVQSSNWASTKKTDSNSGNKFSTNAPKKSFFNDDIFE